MYVKYSKLRGPAGARRLRRTPLGDRIVWENAVTGKGADLGVGRSNHERHCKPGACVLGLTGANMQLNHNYKIIAYNQ